MEKGNVGHDTGAVRLHVLYDHQEAGKDFGPSSGRLGRRLGARDHCRYNREPVGRGQAPSGLSVYPHEALRCHDRADAEPR